MTIASPCISLCRMNPATGYCEGCLRSLEEIAGWSRATDEQKRAILRQVAERRALAELFEGDLRGDCDR
ncbi:MAG: DUF1289 domain-containing protein [Zoogloea sp.]|nr:DUF1289 domain-containing protein [Zoogloea sp.]